MNPDPGSSGDAQTTSVPRHGILAAAGPIQDIAFLRSWGDRLEQPVFIVAANGGRRNLDRLGWIPNLQIGDQDSLTDPAPDFAGPTSGCDSPDSEKWSGNSTEYIVFPAEKETTDFELALQHLLENDAMHQISIIGGLGGRFDHALANVFVASGYVERGPRIEFVDGTYVMNLVTSSIEICRGRFQFVSLLPVTRRVSGVTTRGLKYSLSAQTLRRESSRGVSNEWVADRAVVSVESGCLLVIQTRDDRPGDSTCD